MGCGKSKLQMETADVNVYNDFHDESSPPPPATNEVDQRYQDFKGECATFGCGGDFRKAQAQLSLIQGVVRSRTGYSGGAIQLDKKRTKIRDHTEVVDIEFDPAVTTFEALIEAFWQTHDQTKKHAAVFHAGSPERRFEKKEEKVVDDEGKKRNDSVIFYHSKEQKDVAVEAQAMRDREIHSNTVLMAHVGTYVEAAKHVYPAEKEHQQHFLQQDKFLSKQANCHHSLELQYSHLACKLNALCSDFATKEHLEVALADLNVSDEVSAYLRTKIKYNKRNS